MDTLIQYAEDLINAGIVPFPVYYSKEPIKGCMWQTWEAARLLEEFYREETWGLAIRTAGMEVIDVDNKLGSAYEILYQLIKKHPWVLDCPIAKTQSYGYHIFYKYEKGMSGKLAYQKDIYGDWQGVIERKGMGGYVVTYPSAGYQFINKELKNIITIDSPERDGLIASCKRMNRKPKRKERVPYKDWEGTGIIAEARSLLKIHGWKFDGRHVTRPGKRGGTSATFGIVKPGLFYVFTANGGIFEPETAYMPFQVIAKLKFNEDIRETTIYCKEKFG